MENNDYYEPTIKTSRKNKKFKEDLLNVCSNFAKVSLDCIEKQNNELELLQQEKQQLIFYLENKIDHINKLINPKKNLKPYGEELHLLENSLNCYKEVLDFVNKGYKE